ncbi:MAG: methylated-DNA--[protein]-cysteine S-methyltransferase [Chlorobi bacterium]|nr:methylated-DNA--[protein]-cysteine S-methyltransferase [Chlorobiota bacterium]
MIISFQQSAIGRIGIAESGGAITNLCFEHDLVPEGAEPGTSDLLREAFRQLHAYVDGGLRVFNLPVNPYGTPFMQEVWRQVTAVPFGQTASYRDIARAAGNPNAFRAVGMANRRNPIPLFIPCHRIIGANGKLTGYRGGLALKRRLLDLEQCRPLPSG